MIPCSYRASTCLAALPSCVTLYAVSVRQARGLPVSFFSPSHPASFRFRLTTDTLAFGYLLPATGRIRVFHPLETCAAGRTMHSNHTESLLPVWLLYYYIVTPRGSQSACKPRCTFFEFPFQLLYNRTTTASTGSPSVTPLLQHPYHFNPIPHRTFLCSLNLFASLPSSLYRPV